MCPACGGSGRAYGDEQAVWCQACGGVGHVAGDTGRPGSPVPGAGGGILTGLGSLLLVVVVLGLPVVALVIVMNWFVGLAGPLRAVVEAVPGGLGVVTAAGGEGSPAVVTSLAGSLAVLVVLALLLSHRRAVLTTRTQGEVWKARGWGALLGLAAVSAAPFVLTVWAVGSGRDLAQPEVVPTMGGPVAIGIVAAAVLGFAWLWTGRRYLAAQRRADRRAARAGGA
jgi:hypothetical protein